MSNATTVVRILETPYIKALLAREPWRSEVGEGPQPLCHGMLQFDAERTHYHCVACGRISKGTSHPHPTTPRHQQRVAQK